MACQQRWALLRWQDHRETAAEHVALGIAIHPAISGIDRAVAAIEIDHGNTNRRVPDDLTKQRGQRRITGWCIARAFIRHDAECSFPEKNYTRFARAQRRRGSL